MAHLEQQIILNNFTLSVGSMVLPSTGHIMQLYNYRFMHTVP